MNNTILPFSNVDCPLVGSVARLWNLIHFVPSLICGYF